MDVRKLLDEIRPQFEVKEYLSSSPCKKEDSWRNSDLWRKRFQQEYVLGHSQERDDLVFFVKCKDHTEEEEDFENYSVEVFRKDSKSLPNPLDEMVVWDQTLFLNLILHEFEYHVTCSAITVHPGTTVLDSTLLKISQQVYPSPNKRRMDRKGECDIVYPNIMFCFDNFDDVFSGLHLSAPDQKIAIQLTAINKHSSINRLVFLGAVDYSSILDTFEKKEKEKLKHTSLSSKFKLLPFIPKNSVYSELTPYQFIQMRGPNEHGFAEMAIRKKNPPHDPITRTDISMATNGSHMTITPPTEGVGQQKFKYSPELRHVLRLGGSNGNTVTTNDGYERMEECDSESQAARSGYTSRTGSDNITDCRRAGEASEEKTDHETLLNHSKSLGAKETHPDGNLLGHTSSLGLGSDGKKEVAYSSEAENHSSQSGEEHSHLVVAMGNEESAEFPQQDLSEKKSKIFTKMKKMGQRTLKKIKTSGPDSPPLLYTYLTYIQLPWYFLIQDILNNTNEKLLYSTF